MRELKKKIGILSSTTSDIKSGEEGLPRTTFGFSKSGAGFIALITILIILGVVLLVGLGVTQLSFGELQMSLQKFQSSQSFYLANLCAEDALMKLKGDIDYSGETISNIENGSCAILVDGNWTVNVSANFQNQIKKMKIVVSQINPEMIIDSWQEVSEF